MNANPQILELLRDILSGECNRSSLAKWLAERSLRFYESPDEIDRMIVADLDVALGEVQRGNCGDEFLVETANRLVAGLDLMLPDRVIIIDLIDSQLVTSTSSSNSGGTPMAVTQVELVPSSA